MTLRYASPSNTFIPEATGQVIAYVRKPEQFKLNKYVQLVPAPKTVGVFAKFGRDSFVRVNSDAEFAWQDGDERPKGHYHQVPFEWTEFRTFRRAYPWTLGDETIEGSTGSLPIKQVYQAMAASIAMTNRTNRVITLLQTAGNWGSNTAAANTLNGGAGIWPTGSDDPTSPNYDAIYKSLVAAAQAIHLATNAVVQPTDLVTIISPSLAKSISSAPELQNYVRESPFAAQFVKEGFDPQYQLWGVPQTYRGFKIVVEDAPIVAERALASGVEATTNRTYIKNDTTAVMVARPGSLDGVYGAPSFSTVQIYHHGGLMEVEERNDNWNRRTEGSVSENYKEVLASNISGYLITNVS